MFGRHTELLEGIREEIALTREEIARSHGEIARSHGEIARSRAAYENQLQITREVIRRNELAFEDFRRAVADLSDQIRAQTAAILRLLDSGGQDPATAG